MIGNVMWPSWAVLPLLLGSCIGVIACLYLTVYSVLYLARPEAGHPRLYGLRFFGIGLLCLIPLVITLTCRDRLPIVF